MKDTTTDPTAAATRSWLPSPAPEPRARLENVHPGDVLREEFLAPLRWTPAALARATGLPAAYVRGLARGESGVTREAAELLSRHLGTSVAFWLHLQAAYDREEG